MNKVEWFMMLVFFVLACLVIFVFFRTNGFCTEKKVKTYDAMDYAYLHPEYQRFYDYVRQNIPHYQKDKA